MKIKKIQNNVKIVKYFFLRKFNKYKGMHNYVR